MQRIDVIKIIMDTLTIAFDDRNLIPVIKELEKLGASCVLREGVKKAGPVITDNGNMILDCTWKAPVDPAEMEEKINKITGVVECGFFTKIHPVAFIAREDGTVTVR